MISNLNGLLTFNGNISTADGTARTDTLTATGDILLTGNLLNTVAPDAHIWSKAGVGTLAIQGTASTEVGAFNISNGTVAINAIGALNLTNANGGIQIANGGTFGVLNYLGSAATGAGQSSNEAIILLGTTGWASIFANQQLNSANTGATGLTLTSGVAATGAGAKSLYLGGYNNSGGSAVVNAITGVIQDDVNSSTAADITSLVKGGSGTWLYAPTPTSYVTTAATGVTVSSGGAVNTNSFVPSSVAGLVVGESVTGTDVPSGSVITAINGTHSLHQQQYCDGHSRFDGVDLWHHRRSGRRSHWRERCGGEFHRHRDHFRRCSSGAADGRQRTGSAPLLAVSSGTTTNNIVFNTEPKPAPDTPAARFSCWARPTA